MGRFLIITALCAGLLGATPAEARSVGNYAAGSAKKLGFGICDYLYAPVELLAFTALVGIEAERYNPLLTPFGLAIGFVQGAGVGTVRSLRGTIRVLTFPIVSTEEHEWEWLLDKPVDFR
jgi:hypothetical protein